MCTQNLSISLCACVQTRLPEDAEKTKVERERHTLGWITHFFSNREAMKRQKKRSLRILLTYVLSISISVYPSELNEKKLEFLVFLSCFSFFLLQPSVLQFLLRTMTERKEFFGVSPSLLTVRCTYTPQRETSQLWVSSSEPPER